MEGISVLVPAFMKNYECIICGCKVGKRFSGGTKKGYYINNKKCLEIWNNQKIIVDGNHRVCTTCNTSKLFIITKTLSMDLATTPSLLNRIMELLNTKVESNQNQQKEEEKEEKFFMGLNYTSLSDKSCEEACGLLPEVLEQLSLLIGKDPNQIFEFFIICRQGISQRFTGVLMDLNQSNISRRFNKILNLLTNKFVSLYLGSTAFTWESIKEKHTPKMFSEIWPNIIGVLDGTYIYCEKSSDFDVQKRII